MIARLLVRIGDDLRWTGERWRDAGLRVRARGLGLVLKKEGVDGAMRALRGSFEKRMKRRFTWE